MAQDSDFLSLSYTPKNVEAKWIKDSNQNQKNDSSEIFSIAIPPPNVTGNLHLGHALNTTIQDILIKFNSLKGSKTLWSLGTDHAGIATQLLVEKSLISKGVDPKEIKRDELLSHIWKWKEENGGNIINQLKTLGLSCDWDNPKFTLDEDLVDSVNEAFIRLFEKGLIYQEETLVNWDTKLKTAISDLEVVSENRKSKMYYFKYPLNNSKEHMIVSTTRPETVFGDVALAVNPDDKLNSQYIGQKVSSPFNGQLLDIISDEYADLSKGSGVVKITPGHDFNDYEIAKKNNLNIVNILNDDGTLNNSVPVEFRNLTVLAARTKVLDLMDDLDLFIKEEVVDNTIPIGDRSGEVVEPLLKKQWFLDVKGMAKKSIKAVEDGDINFKPKFWENTFFEWMNKIQPWCISRQIIWGHQIPIWSSDDGKMVAARNPDDANKKFYKLYKKKMKLTQDINVLDTWFSSSLWPFSTLGWPNETKEYNEFFPTSLLVTGFDIIFFWVSRMIMMSLELTEKVPFKTVYIHNLIRDKKGEKMSKTKGNVVDPLDLIGEHGTDSLRFFLASSITPHSDIKLSNTSLNPYTNYMNKIWNACKFILINNDEELEDVNAKAENFYDSWIAEKFNILLEKYRHHLDECEVEKAAYLLYHFFWDDYCDWYIEVTKISFFDKSAECSSNTRSIMKNIFISYLNLLYPICPLISLELNNQLQNKTSNANFTKLPDKIEIDYNGNFSKQFKIIQDLTVGIRSLRKNLMISPSEKIDCFYSLNDEDDSFISANTNFILKLGNISSLSNINESSDLQFISTITDSGTISFIKESNIDFTAQINKLKKDLISLDKSLALSNSKLKNRGFTSSAPEDVIKVEEKKVSKFTNDIDKIKDLLNQLS